MKITPAKPYSYRDDPDMPEFDDSHPILIFDGICVLCFGGAVKLMRWDRKNMLRYATAQSRLGQALLRHYGCDTENFNTVLLVSRGKGFIKSDVYIEIACLLGGLWSLLTVVRWIPRSLRDRIYDFKAKNRYKWFGKTDYCSLLQPEQRQKFIDI